MNQRKDGRKVLTVAIRFRAKVIAQKKLIENVKVSNDWCNRFMKRNQPSVRAVTSVGQILPNDWEEKIENFKLFINETKAEINIQDIGNMDEVSMSFDMPDNFTVDQKGTEYSDRNSIKGNTNIIENTSNC